MMLLEWDAMLVDRQRYVCPFCQTRCHEFYNLARNLDFTHVSVILQWFIFLLQKTRDWQVSWDYVMSGSFQHQKSSRMQLTSWARWWTHFSNLFCVLSSVIQFRRRLHCWGVCILPDNLSGKHPAYFLFYQLKIHGSRVKDTCTYLQWGSSLVTSTATCNESLWKFEDWLFSVAPNLLVQLEFILLSGLQKKRRRVDLSHRIELNPLLLDVMLAVCRNDTRGLMMARCWTCRCWTWLWKICSRGIL